MLGNSRCDGISKLMMKLPLILLLITSWQTMAQTSRNIKNETYLLRDFLAENHVEPRTLDDAFSQNVFNNILDQLDPDKLLFTTEDIAWLEAYRNAIDDELKGGNWVFLNRLTERYQSCLQRSKHFIPEMLASVSWNEEEYFNNQKTIWEKDEAGLRKRHRAWLKFQVLEKVAWFMERDSVADRNAIKVYGQDAVEHIKKIQLRNIDNILNYKFGFADYVSMIFFHAVTAAYDPHTLYLSVTDFRNFKNSLATEGLYFGFTIDSNEDGDIAIVALTPGSPAWKSGEMHISDVLVSVKKDGSDVIDLNGMSIDEANAVLDEIDDQELEFTLRKADGVKKTVRLKKEKIEAEENFVRSFILEGEQKVGYIHLPDFYTQWTDETEGSRCANDVAKEIMKLKRDGIKGLILDVRFNRGGSLYEAMAMAGIFIDQGALGMMRDNKNQITVLKDMNRGTVYDGPLVIMVNGQSASASEFLAAVLQDYNRALIVGGQTYGKGTGQTILPVNKSITPESAVARGEGFVKVTTEKLYRVTGGSVQGKGLTPDIKLPDFFRAMRVSEAHTPFSLKADSVIKNTFYKPFPSFDRKTLREKSAARIGQNPFFQELTKVYDWYEKEFTNQNNPLLWEDYYNIDQQKKTKIAATKNVSLTDNSLFEIRNNSAEAERIKADLYVNSYNSLWLKKLSGDLYLHETFQIISDFINLHP